VTSHFSLKESDRMKTAKQDADETELKVIQEPLDFKPLWDYCLIKPIVQKETRGGLHLPQGAKTYDDSARGLCVKAGPGAYRDNGTFVPNPIKVGDIVYHMARMQPFKVILKGELYLCVSGRDCVALAESEEATSEL